MFFLFRLCPVYLHLFFLFFWLLKPCVQSPVLYVFLFSVLVLCVFLGCWLKTVCLKPTPLCNGLLICYVPLRHLLWCHALSGGVSVKCLHWWYSKLFYYTLLQTASWLFDYFFIIFNSVRVCLVFFSQLFSMYVEDPLKLRIKTYGITNSIVWVFFFYFLTSGQILKQSGRLLKRLLAPCSSWQIMKTAIHMHLPLP